MRKILGVYSPPRPHWVGDGFPVRSLFSPQTLGSRISPFLMLDYAGPYAFSSAERRRGVGKHPHRGFETVTVVYSGEVEHRDSTGADGVIGPGDVQWMTAGAGVLHDEFHSRAFTENGGVLEMVQFWVNLPARDKMAAPRYQAILDKDIPSIALPEGAGMVRVIAGEYDGHKGPARTFTSLDVWDVRLKAGGAAAFTLPEVHTLAIVALAGKVEVNGAQIAGDAQVVLFEPRGGAITLAAGDDAKLLVLSGAPINEPVAAYGPFVMNTQEEVKQAIVDLSDGRFGQMPA